MAKGTKIKATFSNGEVLTRTTTMKSLVTGYGWMIRGVRTAEAAAAWGGKYETGHSGFSGSEQLAKAQISSSRQYMGTVTFEEIVKTEVVE